MAMQHEAFQGRSNIFKIDPRQIVIKEGWNQRTDFGDLDELAKSIAENGVLNPVHFIKNDAGEIEIVDGERRLKATLLAIKNGADIQAIPGFPVDKKKSEIDRLFIQLIANDGKRFNPVEEAGIYQRFIVWGLSVKDIADKTGRSLQHVYKRLELNAASPEVKKALADKKITIEEAIEVAAEDTIEGQSEKLSDKKENGLKSQRKTFNPGKFKSAFDREYKKFKKYSHEEQVEAKKEAVKIINEMLKAFDLNESEFTDENQLSLLEGGE